MFYRNILEDLKAWAESKHRRVLILRGARQVGKTTAVRMFSSDFDTYIELNIEIPEDREMFDNYTNIQHLFNHILLKKQIQCKGKKTLLFIDEIQGSVNAMRSLRFFHEQMPDLYVIASGSLLDLYLYREKFEISVGRVEYLRLYPMTFDEFLKASGQEQLLKSVKEDKLPDYVASVLRTQFLSYALVGGMPEVVKIWLESQNIDLVRKMLADLLQSYNDDVLKYARTTDQSHVIRHIMETAFSEIANQISFEGFGASKFKSQSIRNAFNILEKSSIVTLLYPYTSQELPVIPKKTRRPKLLFLDIGLVNYQANIMAEYYSAESLNTIYRGKAMEALVGQMLTAMKEKYGFELSFWKREERGSTAEVDYVMIWCGKMLPIEVKAGKTGTLRSLLVFMEEAPHEFAFRIYDGKYSVEDAKTPSGKSFKLINVPLSLTFRLPEIVKQYLD